MKWSRIAPPDALKLKPGLDLDVFVFDYIFNSIVEDNSIPIPRFSRSASGAKMLLVRLAQIIEKDSMIVQYGIKNYKAAVDAGHVFPGNTIRVWTLQIGDSIAHGRTFEDAICKISIVLKMRGILA